MDKGRSSQKDVVSHGDLSGYQHPVGEDDIAPDQATKPYTYTIDGGTAISSSADPLTFDLTFTSVGTHTVEVAVWNCEMTTPLVGAINVSVIASEPLKFYIYLPILLRLG